MIYVYRCPTCGTTVELIRTIADRDKPVICKCGALMHRCFNSQVVVIVEGGRFVGSPSRWYEHALDMQRSGKAPPVPEDT